MISCFQSITMKENIGRNNNVIKIKMTAWDGQIKISRCLRLHKFH